ncbi:MAG: SGNH/GDSL hydrolase family protein [Sphingobacteriales bacterium]|nr:SGNH/GDSL hydrolase family protein [Sphingobacteriales bacterium]
MINYTYLALGDSYTIGEQVPFEENYPNRTVQLLRERGLAFHAPEILARTGWTTDELQAGIHAHLFLPRYDFVSLLIGVNDQYRGRSAEDYKEPFESLLKQALSFAGNQRERVVVLSIPDWSCTPFAANHDRVRIQEEINRFNEVNKQIAGKLGIHYIYITSWTREAAADSSLLAADGLHPSGKEYGRWAAEMADYFRTQAA